MLSDNRVIMATAGSEKTSTIVKHATASACCSALITYTNNASAELHAKTLSTVGYVPEHIEVNTWFSFLLRHLVRPYQLHLHDTHIGKLLFVQGWSRRYVRESDTDQYYFGRPGEILSDKIAQFAVKLIEDTGGKPIDRLERIFSRIYVDESQDLAGYDLDIVEYLLDSSISVTLMGDHRQATYSTNNARKNSAYRGVKIVKKYEEWNRSGRANLEYQNESWRCVQPICDFADALFPDFPRTTSLNRVTTGHDGVYAIGRGDLPGYLAEYGPTCLRYNRRYRDVEGMALNFGEAKGMTFERTVIYPHNKLMKFLRTGNLEDAGAAIAKIYVGVTRARQSVAFVVPDSDQEYIVPRLRL